MTDWTAWRKCPVCGAGIGQPCKALTGVVVDGRAVDAVEVPMDTPHFRRRERGRIR